MATAPKAALTASYLLRSIKNSCGPTNRCIGAARACFASNLVQRSCFDSRRPVDSEVMFFRLAKAVAVVLLVFPSLAFGCICNGPPETTGVALKHYDAVFAGRVLRIKYPRTKRPRNRIVFLDRVIYVTLKVERTWKSVDSGEITIVTPFSDCHYPFKVNQEYLVWAYSSSQSPNTLETNLCDRTNRLADATNDLNTLGDGRAPH